MKKTLSLLKNNWQWITLLSAILGVGFSVGNWFNEQNETLENTTKLAQKSVIWNDNIPVTERAEACDLYLSAGYDSYTKKLCENVILNDDVFFEEKEGE